MAKISVDDYHFKLIIIVTVFLFIFKFFRTPDHYAIVYNSIVEFVVLFFLFIIFKILSQDKTKKKAIIVWIGYYIVFLINLSLFSLTNYFFNDMMSIKYSLLSLDTNYVSFFINSIIKPSLILYIVIFLLILFLIPFLKIPIVPTILKKNLKGIDRFVNDRRNQTPLIVFILFVIISFSFLLAPSMNNIYSTTIIDISRLASQKYVSISKDLDDAKLKPLSTEFDDYDNYSIKRDRVLIFVMEQVSYNEFLNASDNIKEDENFFSRVKNNSHYFTDYYTQNQDSLGGLWSLFFSTFIPFESYINDWNDEFGFVLEKENIVDLFNFHNYTTIAALSQLQSSLILGAFDWDRSIYLPSYPVDDLLCIDELEYQSACEDIALIEDVKDSINDTEDLFLFQEFVFGHSESYITKSGKSRVEYYNMYLNLIYDFLEKENLVNKTTIVILADHGEKGFFDKKINDYNIPLIIVDSQIGYKKIDRLYSHLDFKDILMSYVDEQRKLPPQREELFIIGQTASSEFAYINLTRNHFTAKRFLKNMYTYRSFEMNEQEVKRSIEQIILQQKNSRNLSSSKEFYCVHCDNQEGTRP